MEGDLRMAVLTSVLHTRGVFYIDISRWFGNNEARGGV